jgi:hypothetical protein
MAEVTTDCRKLHNDGLHELYSSPNITRVNKLRKIRWKKYVARKRRKNKNPYRGLVGYMKKKTPLEIRMRRWGKYQKTRS